MRKGYPFSQRDTKYGTRLVSSLLASPFSLLKIDTESRSTGNFKEDDFDNEKSHSDFFISLISYLLVTGLPSYVIIGISFIFIDFFPVIGSLILIFGLLWGGMGIGEIIKLIKRWIKFSHSNKKVTKE